MAKNEIKLKDVVDILEKSGNDVKYYKRKDGSLVITQINGRRFKDKEGNAEARRIVGVTLSESRKNQLEVINKQNEIARKRKGRPRIELPEDIERQIKRINDHLRKSKVKQRATKRNVAWQVAHYGEAVAREKLKQMERYGRGIAWTDNILHFRNRLADFGYKLEENKILEIVALLDVIIKNDGMNMKHEVLERTIWNFYKVEEAYIKEQEITGLVENFNIIAKGELQNVISSYRKKKI